MIYHVDLLQDGERRSASPIDLGMLLRLGVFGLVSLILLMILLLFFSSREAQNKELDARSKWDALKAQYAGLQAMRNTLKELRASYRQVDACMRSRLDLGAELEYLQQGIPDAIQFTALRVNQFVGAQKVGASFARSYELRISGKVVGDTPKETVDELIQYLSSATFTGRVESVSVPPNSFRKETVRVAGTGETHTDWFFELVCRYRARSFE